MKLAQYKTKDSDRPQLGALVGEELVSLTALAGGAKKGGGPEWLTDATTLLDLIRRGPQGLAEVEALVRGAKEGDARLKASPGAVEFLPPVRPTKIIAIGRNYLDHAAEGGSDVPKAPLIFMKLPNALSAHGAPIVLPSISEQVDYEAELAVVIGRRAKRVAEAEALDYVFGYSLLNDVSARDLQFSDGQWIRGKGLDTFAPLGPFVTTRDEVADVQALKIEGRLNGQVMQSSNTSKMIFKVAYLVSYISQGITLEPGDVIATGTPEGVGVFRKPPVLLKPGDVFEVAIEKLGTLSNPVVGGE